MKLSRLLAVAVPMVALTVAARADDTSDFLSPANWEGRTDIWKIENGKVIGETTEDPKYNTFFVSKQKYTDFEISYKCRLRDGVGNSGVQVRSEVFGEKEKYRVKGPQVDVGQGYFGSLYAEGYGMMKASTKEQVALAKPKEFNEYHVVVRGNHVTVKMNGETTVDADFPTLPAKKGEEGAPFPASGVIAFQCHAGYPKMRVEFTDIKFKDLSKK